MQSNSVLIFIFPKKPCYRNCGTDSFREEGRDRKSRNPKPGEHSFWIRPFRGKEVNPTGAGERKLMGWAGEALEGKGEFCSKWKEKQKP